MIETSKSCHFLLPESAVWLVDNGSLRRESILALRQQALLLEKAAGIPVEAVSVLHSNKVPAQQLDGQPGKVFTHYLRTCAAGGLRRLLVVPYFFGNSAALTEYLPRQIARVQQDFPHLQVRIAPPLVDMDNLADAAAEEIAGLLARNIEALLLAGKATAAGGAIKAEHTDTVKAREGYLAKGAGMADLPAAVLVDHGSPQPAVSAVRDRVGEALGSLLQGRVRAFATCSMEAREGEQYAHALPLLEQVLARAPFNNGRVIVAPLFLSPGRHAGEGGDLWQIAEQSEAVHPSLRVVFCPLAGGTAEVTTILLRRLRGQLNLFK